jgi:hypothetical protein
VLSLAQSTDFWSPKGEWRSWLPHEVQRAVVVTLLQGGQSEMTWKDAPVRAIALKSNYGLHGCLGFPNFSRG